MLPTRFILSDSIANTLGGKNPRFVDAWSPGRFNFSQLGDSVGDTMGLVSLDSDWFLYKCTERFDFLGDFYGRREEAIRLISALFSGTYLSALFSCHLCFCPPFG